MHSMKSSIPPFDLLSSKRGIIPSVGQEMVRGRRSTRLEEVPLSL